MKISRVITAAAVLLALALSLCSCGTARPDGAQRGVSVPAPESSAAADDGKVKATFTAMGETVGESGPLEKGTVLDPVEMSVTEDLENYYEFLGWDADGDGSPEEFPYTLNETTCFDALIKVTPKEFSYEIYVRGELVQSGVCHYCDHIDYPEVKSTIEDGKVFLFMGWKYDGVFDGTIRPYISHDTVIEAYFAETQILLRYLEGGTYAQYVPAGSELPSLEYLGVEPKQGYDTVWYTDSGYKTRADITVMPEGDLTLYGRREKQGGHISVKSDEELIKAFNSLLLARAGTAALHLDYDHMPFSELMDFLDENGVSLYYYLLSASYGDNILTLEIKYGPLAEYRSEKVLYRQLPSANVTLAESPRGESYDSFAVNRLGKTMTVNNSNALFYALEHGMRPVIEDGSGELAELYEIMKNVLRRYVSDDMTDIQKAAAIYEYLIMSTVYDGEVLEKMSKGEDVEGYRSFEPEGVFIDRLAVCDGLSKAFSCLCNMEGIECVRITGEIIGDGIGHAWNKVKLGGKWYIVDVTSGGTLTGDEEVLTYSYFMLTDRQYSTYAKADKGDVIKCADEYDIYADMGLKAGSPEEAAKLLKSYLETAPEGRSTFEFELGYETSSVSAAAREIFRLVNMYADISLLAKGRVICFIYDK